MVASAANDTPLTELQFTELQFTELHHWLPAPRQEPSSNEFASRVPAPL